MNAHELDVRCQLRAHRSANPPPTTGGRRDGHGVYKGTDFFELVGEPALLQIADDGTVLAQFDGNGRTDGKSSDIGHIWTHGWAKFDAADFDIRPAVDWSEPDL